MTEATFSFYAGLGAWGTVRKEIEKLKFMGHDIKLWEGAGWITRDFVVRGDATAVKAVQEWVERLATQP